MSAVEQYCLMSFLTNWKLLTLSPVKGMTFSLEKGRMKKKCIYESKLFDFHEIQESLNQAT